MFFARCRKESEPQAGRQAATASASPCLQQQQQQPMRPDVTSPGRAIARARVCEIDSRAVLWSWLLRLRQNSPSRAASVQEYHPKLQHRPFTSFITRAGLIHCRYAVHAVWPFIHDFNWITTTARSLMCPFIHCGSTWPCLSANTLYSYFQLRDKDLAGEGERPAASTQIFLLKFTSKLLQREGGEGGGKRSCRQRRRKNPHTAYTRRKGRAERLSAAPETPVSRQRVPLHPPGSIMQPAASNSSDYGSLL